ncbi:MAG: O-antigen ligase family protein [Deltaproteobacteria bacterium]|nr:O-antigen ligase family protein [Deltaproteobacteria bacterium]
MTAAAKGTAGQADLRPWLGAFLLLIALEVLLAPFASPMGIAAVLWLCTAALIVERRFGLWTLLTMLACLSLPQALAAYVTRVPFGIFVADLAVIPLLAAAVVRVLRTRVIPPYLLHFVAIVAAGVALTAYGVLGDNAFFDAVGVFRRICVYPLVFLAAVVLLQTTAPSLVTLERMVLAAAGVIGLIVAWRLVTGQGYAHEYMEGLGVPDRYLSHLESVGLIFAMILGLGHVATDRQYKGRWLVFVGLGLVCLVASNYRTVWLAFVIAATVWAWTSDQSSGRLMVIGFIALGLAIGIATLVVWQVDPTSLAVERFSVDNLRRGMNWRWGSWTRAVEVFLESPIFGTGFGYRHEFEYVTGRNFDVVHMSRGHTIHNDLLWLLVNGGVVGTGLVLTLHLRWWGRCLRALSGFNRQTPEARFISAALATHVAAIMLSMFQPFFSSPAPVVAIHLIMGIALVLAIRLERQAQRVSLPQDRVVPTTRSIAGARTA